jgi:post-segregation antitoxin (ccd killing protein)
VAEPTRRTRRIRSVDVTTFADEVADALRAFGHDVSYAVSMARAAVAIESKRRAWEARKEIRAAEAAARIECASHDFHCHAQAPCGVGDCKFAQGELSQLHVNAGSGKVIRPQRHDTADYSIESAVAALLEHRKAA